MAEPPVELQVVDVLSERAACAAGEVGLEQIAAGNQLTDFVDAGFVCGPVALPVPTASKRLQLI